MVGSTGIGLKYHLEKEEHGNR